MSTQTTQTPQSSRTQPTSAWRIVAEREVRAKFSERAFIWGFLAMVLVLWAGLVALDYFGDRDTTYDIGVVGAPADVTDNLETTLGEGYKVTGKEYDDRSAADAAIADGDVHAALVVEGGAWTLVADNDVDASKGTLRLSVGPWGRLFGPILLSLRCSTSERWSSGRARAVA